MKNSHAKTSMLRKFIRESLENKGTLSEQSVIPTELWKQSAETLLNWAIPPAGLGSDIDPCANFWMYMSEQENKKHAHFILGLMLGGIGTGMSAKGAVSLFSGAWRAATGGRYLAALGSSVLGGLLGWGAIVTSEDTYRLAFLTLSDKETLESDGILSDYQRNREIAKILGNLYIAATLGSFSGQTLSGKEVSNALRSAESFNDFRKALFNSYTFLNQKSAYAVVNGIIGSSFENFYNSGALEELKKLDKDMLYNINSEFANTLANQISRDEPRENSTFTSAEAYKHWLIEKIEEMCKQGRPRQEIQPYFDQFLVIKRSSG